MEMRSALIVGAGTGLSASLARLFARNGLQVALASRNPDRLAALANETAAATFACEVAAPVAMGKFALRGLAQSMARELSPQGIHVAHFVIDGAIRNPGRVEPADKPDSMLDPDAIAASYWHVAQQPRSAWTWEVELRPWVERF